jgi:threonine dehydrogenase-like Zn-dependent dehydrogenase
LTHLLAGPAIGGAGDALATAAAVDGQPRRLFVPGVLPCGECPSCRRGLCVACPQARPAFAGAGPAVVRASDLPDRFLVPIADDDELSPLQLMAAGLVTEVMAGAARAGLGPGETAVWIGEAPWARLGAGWSARRGCRTFLLAPAIAGDTPAGAGDTPADVERLDPGAGAADWRRAVESVEAAGGPMGGRPERKIFVCGAAPPFAEAALALAVPGATLSFLRGAPGHLSGLDTGFPLRLFTGSALHPDLVIEAMAAIRRGEVDVASVLREVAPAGHDAAVEEFRAGRDPRVPVIVF